MTDTPNTTQGKGAIDWSRPIEAVHKDGRVVPMHFDGKTWDRRAGRVWLTTDSPAGNSNESWRENGEDFCRNSGWRIRNVPEHPTPTQYAPELVERMVALCQIIASSNSHLENAWAREARSIVSDLPQEVDPDEAYADQLLREQGWTGDPTIGAAAVRTMIAQAHGAGRQLQRGEAAFDPNTGVRGPGPLPFEDMDGGLM